MGLTMKEHNRILISYLKTAFKEADLKFYDVVQFGGIDASECFVPAEFLVALVGLYAAVSKIDANELHGKRVRPLVDAVVALAPWIGTDVTDTKAKE